MLCWIHSSRDQTSALQSLHHHCCSVRISFRTPAPPPPHQQAPHSPNFRGWDSWESSLPSAAACAGHSAATAQMMQPARRVTHRRHPSENGSVSGAAREEETCRIESWARAPCICSSDAREEDFCCMNWYPVLSSSALYLLNLSKTIFSNSMFLASVVS